MPIDGDESAMRTESRPAAEGHDITGGVTVVLVHGLQQPEIPCPKFPGRQRKTSRTAARR